MENWTGRVVWITGASSGIGESLARAFWLQGASLVLSARRMPELERVKDALPARPGQQVFILQHDISDTAIAPQKAEEVVQKAGRIDVLVNNAGVSQRSYVVDTGLDVDRRIMETNFFGTVALTKAVLPYMLTAGYGKFVVISSISGKFGFYLRSAYAASKHALHGFFDSLRMEVYKQGISVLIVCPGKIKTPLSLSALKGDGSAHGVMDNSLNKGRSPEDLAKVVLQALSGNQEEIYFGGKEIRAVWIKQYFPRLFSKLIRKQNPE